MNTESKANEKACLTVHLAHGSSCVNSYTTRLIQIPKGEELHRRSGQKCGPFNSFTQDKGK